MKAFSLRIRTKADDESVIELSLLLRKAGENGPFEKVRSQTQKSGNTNLPSDAVYSLSDYGGNRIDLSACAATQACHGQFKFLK